jgi:16S rRNA (uracil1498-N3)-methyltransferase
MASRYFLSGNIAKNGIGRLDEDQAHHATQVMRMAIGDLVHLFDSNGNEYIARIQQIEKKSLTFVVLETKSADDLSHPMICVAACLPKGDRQKFMIEKLVELGVDQFIPLRANRSVAVASVNVISRHRKGVIEATKQCGRKRLMELSSEQSLSELIEATSEEATWLRLLANPSGESSLSDIEMATQPRVVVAIGPEGGFDNLENEMLVRANWKRVRVGNSILRIETAAIAAAALLIAKRDQA